MRLSTGHWVIVAAAFAVVLLIRYPPRLTYYEELPRPERVA